MLGEGNACSRRGRGFELFGDEVRQAHCQWGSMEAGGVGPSRSSFGRGVPCRHKSHKEYVSGPPGLMALFVQTVEVSDGTGVVEGSQKI